jgi:hypothetical protein
LEVEAKSLGGGKQESAGHWLDHYGVDSSSFHSRIGTDKYNIDRISRAMALIFGDKYKWKPWVSDLKP